MPVCVICIFSNLETYCQARLHLAWHSVFRVDNAPFMSSKLASYIFIRRMSQKFANFFNNFTIQCPIEMERISQFFATLCNKFLFVLVLIIGHKTLKHIRSSDIRHTSNMHSQLFLRSNFKHYLFKLLQS